VSVLNKNWNIKNADPEKNVIQKLLANRGLTDKDQIQAYLSPNYKKGFHNPFVMKNMDRAVERIKKAIADKEKIIIFGDYDVDGISGTAILVKTLQILGARISYRLPHRVKDGYGLSNAFVEDFAKVGVTLVITVDCGISCKNQIALAKMHGIDVIITDHHTIPESIPDQAYAILHPGQPDCNYPFKGLTGAGVALKLASALITDKFEGEERDEYLFSLFDLASLGTVADIGPLQGENRIIVKYGLEALKNTKWPGLQSLKELSGVLPDEKIDINTIGFRISPRLNAAGRIDHPYYALQLLLNDDVAKGKLLALHLEKLNQERQQMVIKAMIEAEEQFQKDQDHLKNGTNQTSNGVKIFIASSPDWHVGILGLIAAKIAEKYTMPSMILQDFGDYLVASARSPEFFNVVEALTAHRDHLEHFGGHAQAAGFNIRKEKLPGFIEAMSAYAQGKLPMATVRPSLNIDCELSADDINENLMTFLEQMEPFGVSNEQPLFLFRGVRPLLPKRVGKEQNHLHFKAEISGQNSGSVKRIPVIAFKLGEHENMLAEGSPIDLVCHLEKNDWKGTSHLQLRAVDFKAAE
jgi:single-stranded-DNA-specific exonuclease